MSKSYLILYICFFFFLGLSAQESSSPQLNRESPANTIYSHLYFLQSENYNAEEAAKTINTPDPLKAKELAIKLKQVLDGRGLYVNFDQIPADTGFIDSLSRKNRYVLSHKIPEIYVERVDGEWLYSRRTADAIPVLHAAIYPFGSDILMNMFPEIGHKQFLGLYLWQYFGILIIAFLTFIVHKLLSFILGLFIKRMIRSSRIKKEQRVVIQKASLPASMMILTILLEYLVPILQLPIARVKYVVLGLDILTVVYATIMVYRLVDLANIYMYKKAEETESNMDDQLVPLIAKMLKMVVVFIGFIFILTVFEVNIAALLTGISIGGLAFALAAQDTIKNLFGSLMIFLDRPFQIGDLISFSGGEGTVEAVGFRSTRLRTVANSLITVPNGEIAHMVVDNLGMRIYRRYVASVGVTYDTPPEKIEKYVQGLREIVAKHPKTRKDLYHVYMHEMGATSLNIFFNIYFDNATREEELKARHEIILEKMRLAEELEIRFAFPTQTLHIEEIPGQASLTPKSSMTEEQMNIKLAAYMEGYKERYKQENKL